MGRGRITVESLLARSLIMVAVGASSVSCDSSIKPVAVECKGHDVFPVDTVAPIPLSGEYLVEPPASGGDECYFFLVYHPQLKALLQMYKEGVLLRVIVPEYGYVNRAMLSAPPKSDSPIEWEFRGLSLKISLTRGGKYLIKYSFDETQLPPMPPTPMPWPDFDKNWKRFEDEA